MQTPTDILYIWDSVIKKTEAYLSERSPDKFPYSPQRRSTVALPSSSPDGQSKIPSQTFVIGMHFPDFGQAHSPG